MDAEQMAFENATFDYVVLSHVLAVTSSPGMILKQAQRVLKPGGRLFVLNHFTPDNPLKYMDRVLGFLGRILHLRSEFSVSDLNMPKDLQLQSQQHLGLFNYYQLLTYRK